MLEIAANIPEYQHLNVHFVPETNSKLTETLARLITWRVTLKFMKFIDLILKILLVSMIRRLEKPLVSWYMHYLDQKASQQYRVCSEISWFMFFNISVNCYPLKTSIKMEKTKLRLA